MSNASIRTSAFIHDESIPEKYTCPASRHTLSNNEDT
jgi:hypothetical protein